MISRLALGTAQFGTPYGVANNGGQPTTSEATEILRYASMAGVNMLDTAIAYGDCEQLLGQIGVGQWQVISKLPGAPEGNGGIADWVSTSLTTSLQKIRMPRLYALLLHRPQQLLHPSGNDLYAALIKLKNDGLVKKIGISIYSPDELDALLPRYDFDLVQAPFSVIDARLATSGWLMRLHQKGIEVHVRSVFLQGLLLMGRSARPSYFSRWQPIWDQWHRWLVEARINPVHACLGFALSHREIDRVVVGVDNLEHLREILEFNGVVPIQPPNALSSQDLDLLHPSRWNA